MKGRVVFVTTELDPLTPGGAGALVARLASRLRADGRPVTVVLVADVPAGDTSHGDELVVVAPPPPDPEAPTPFLARSRAAAAAVAEMAAAGPVDFVEFQDFDGLGSWAFSRRAELGLERVPLAVRMHGPVDLMTEAIGTVPPGLDAVAVMERASLAAADAVVVPSTAMGEIATARYGIEPERLRIGAPIVPAVAAARWRPASPPLLAFYGRLAEVKGAHDFVDAALRLLAGHPDWRFLLVGPDGWSAAADRPMREWLVARIPEEHRASFEFTGRVARADAPALLAAAVVVAVPSRFESFGLAAHEVRAMGLPLVVPDIPAFRDHWSEATGALVYAAGVPGLAAALARIAEDPELAGRLAAAPLPRYDDPLAPYRAAPDPRHPRSQAGLATEAVQRLEAALAPKEVGGVARAARALLRALPEPVARTAVRVLPQRLKDRFRGLASWPAEAERRQREARLAAARRRAGELPELASPEVTVVVPCFNQGAFLDDALASVFTQTFESFEVVIVDDGSTDPATVAALTGLDWPRTRVIRQENRGLPAARNAGIRAARGRYVVPLDADDELTPGFMAELHAALGDRPEAAYAHCWAELFGDVAAIWATRPFNAYQILVSNSVVGCVLLRREAWEAVGGYDETMTAGNEDWELWIRLLEAGWEQVQVREPLFRYRKHGVSMSVATEARYERARLEIARRHPALYDLTALRRRKAACYPWVSVVGGVPPDGGVDDIEEVAAAGEARGKVVVEWTAVADAPAGAIRRLAEALEDHPGAAAAGPVGTPVAWRRWALADPDSGLAGVVAAVPALGVDATRLRLSPGCAPDPDLVVSPRPWWPDLPIDRQPPDVEGPLPVWVEAVQ